MSNLRALCRPHTVFSAIVCCSRNQTRSIVKVSIKNAGFGTRASNLSPSSSSSFRSKDSSLWFRVSQRKTLVRASNWSQEKSPYDTLGKHFFYQILGKFMYLQFHFFTSECQRF